MIPFESIIPWTYGALIMWWVMVIWCGLIASLIGVVLDKGFICYVLTAIVGMLFYWLLTWILVGVPIFNIAEKFNQTL